jgi:hypothetical protein
MRALCASLHSEAQQSDLEPQDVHPTVTEWTLCAAWYSHVRLLTRMLPGHAQGRGRLIQGKSTLRRMHYYVLIISPSAYLRSTSGDPVVRPHLSSSERQASAT